MKAGAVSFVHSTKDFPEVKIEKVEKATALGSEGGPPEGLSFICSFPGSLPRMMSNCSGGDIL